MDSASSTTKLSFVAPFVPRLTLSSCRRPEQTVRLTDADYERLLCDDYNLDQSSCRTLGRGSGGTVKTATRRSDGMLVAVKTIKKHHALGLWNGAGRWRRGSLARTPRLDEVDVLTSLKDSCPGIVQLMDVYETQDEVQLVLEYCEGGDLFDCMQRRRLSKAGPGGSFSESETARLAETLLEALGELHSRSIVHRDIKPENLLLVDQDEGSNSPLGPVKLTDFGLARVLHADDVVEDELSSDDSLVSEGDLSVSTRRRSRAYSRVGSDYYSAPEVHLGAGYDTPVDIYSLGVTLFVMLCGAPPDSASLFKSADDDLTDEDSICMSSISRESTQPSLSSSSGLFPSSAKVSPLAKDLISKMIHPDPDKRITASEALTHGWITKQSVRENLPVTTPTASKISSSSSSDNSNSPNVAKLNVKPIIDTLAANLDAAIALALMDERPPTKRRRHHDPQPERVRFRKRARGSAGRDECPGKKTCARHRSHLTPATCASCRIRRRFDAGGQTFGPFLPGHYESPA